MTSYIIVLQKIIDTTQARPSKRGLDSFKKAVIDVLFEEKSAYYEGRGYYLEAKFKSNKDVIAIVNEFSAKLKPKWEKWYGNMNSLKLHHSDFLNRDFLDDLLKVDFGPMLSIVPPPSPAAAAAPEPMEDLPPPPSEDLPEDLQETPAKNEDKTPVVTPVKRQIGPSQEAKIIKKFRLSAGQPHHVMEAHLQDLRARGKYREAFVIKEMNKDEDLATELQNFIKARKKESEPQVDPLEDPSHLDALALMFKEDWSVKTYKVRTMNSSPERLLRCLHPTKISNSFIIVKINSSFIRDSRMYH